MASDTAPPIPSVPVAAALPYHRLSLAWPAPAWWRPLVGLAIAIGLYLGVIVLFFVVALLVIVLPAVASPTASLADIEDTILALTDLQTPGGLAFTLLSVIPMLPASLIGFRLAGCRPLGLLSSVAGRLRWRWMLACAGPAAIVLVGGLLVGVGIDLLLGADVTTSVAPVASPLFFVLVLLLVPFQAAAEEYAFRGVLIQTLGAWLRHPAWAILLPVPLFVVGHVYDPPGLLAVAVFAVAAGWITWRTGGLEAAIALHVVNNLVAFLLGAVGLSDLAATAQSGGSVAAGIAVPIVFALWIGVRHRRRAPRVS